MTSKKLKGKLRESTLPFAYESRTLSPMTQRRLSAFEKAVRLTELAHSDPSSTEEECKESMEDLKRTRAALVQHLVELQAKAEGGSK